MNFTLQKHCHAKQWTVYKTLKISKIMESTSTTNEQLKKIQYAPQVYSTYFTGQKV
jgi:hypothetical protein